MVRFRFRSLVKRGSRARGLSPAHKSWFGRWFCRRVPPLRQKPSLWDQKIKSICAFWFKSLFRVALQFQPPNFRFNLSPSIIGLLSWWVADFHGEFDLSFGFYNLIYHPLLSGFLKNHLRFSPFSIGKACVFEYAALTYRFLEVELRCVVPTASSPLINFNSIPFYISMLTHFIEITGRIRHRTTIL